jgi:hypothetical protein
MVSFRYQNFKLRNLQKSILILKDFYKQNMHQDPQIMLEKMILVILEHIFFQKIKVKAEDHLIEAVKSILHKNFVNCHLPFLALLPIVNSQISLNKIKNIYQASTLQFLDS